MSDTQPSAIQRRSNLTIKTVIIDRHEVAGKLLELHRDDATLAPEHLRNHFLTIDGRWNDTFPTARRAITGFAKMIDAIEEEAALSQ